MLNVNGAIFKEEIEKRDLTKKEVAALLKRGSSVVYKLINGKPVCQRTVRQVEKHFPTACVHG